MLALRFHRISNPTRYAAADPGVNQALLRWLRTAMGASHVGGTHDPVDTPLLQAHYQAVQQHPQAGSRLHEMLQAVHGGDVDTLNPYADFAEEHGLLSGPHVNALMTMLQTYHDLAGNPQAPRNRRFLDHFDLSGDVAESMARRHAATYLGLPHSELGPWPESLGAAAMALPRRGSIFQSPHSQGLANLPWLRDVNQSDAVPLHSLLTLHDLYREHHLDPEVSGTQAGHLFTGANTVSSSFLAPHLRAANAALGV
jgi:hypothetical protein